MMMMMMIIIIIIINILNIVLARLVLLPLNVRMRACARRRVPNALQQLMQGEAGQSGAQQTRTTQMRTSDFR